MPDHHLGRSYYGSKSDGRNQCPERQNVDDWVFPNGLTCFQPIAYARATAILTRKAAERGIGVIMRLPRRGALEGVVGRYKCVPVLGVPMQFASATRGWITFCRCSNARRHTVGNSCDWQPRCAKNVRSLTARFGYYGREDSGRTAENFGEAD